MASTAPAAAAGVLAPEPDAPDVALVDRRGHLHDHSAPELDLRRLGLARGAHPDRPGTAIPYSPRRLPPVERRQPAVSGVPPAGQEAAGPPDLDVGSKHLAERLSPAMAPTDAPAEGLGRILREHE